MQTISKTFSHLALSSIIAIVVAISISFLSLQVASAQPSHPSFTTLGGGCTNSLDTNVRACLATSNGVIQADAYVAPNLTNCTMHIKLWHKTRIRRFTAPCPSNLHLAGPKVTEGIGTWHVFASINYGNGASSSAQGPALLIGN